MTCRTSSVLAALALAAILAAPGFGQEKATKKAEVGQHISGHVEIPRDAQIDVAREDMPTSLPRILRSRDGYVSVQVNVDGSGQNIVGDAANEPSLAVDPTDRKKMAIGWRQFDSISSDFRQAGWGYSHNGGRTWTFPGCIDAGVFRSDPVLDADADGNFYYNSLTADNSGGTPTDFECKVYKSTDGGATWDNGTFAWGGDKQWQVIDTTDGIGRGNIYCYWNAFYSACSGDFTRSVDNGASFQSCLSLPTGPVWGVLAVGPDGELYLCGDGMTVLKSSNAQDSGQSVSWELSRTVDLDGTLAISSGPNPGGLLGQAWIAVDCSDGPTRGYVYLCASVVRDSSSDPLDVMFSRSTDGGNTWSAPIRINDDASTSNWQWFGTMSVAPNGRIDIIWNDTRNDPGGYDSQVYYACSEDGGVTFSENVSLTPSFDPHVGWPQQNKMGDYFDMISDDMGADLAYSATFNGEQDVYYVRIGSRCDDAGTVELDSAKYACESLATITVNDCGLNTDPNAIDTVQVTLSSTSESAGETVTLSELDTDMGIFEGTLQLSETDAAGVLLIAETDTVTATYIDADDGQGGTNVVVTADAVVDCTPPIISNVVAAEVNPRDATVTFDTDELANATVYYGTSCGDLTETAVAGGFVLNHTVSITDIIDNELYYYVVQAADEAGNISVDDNGGNCYSFMTPEVPDYFTEIFESSDNDLDYLSLIFTPNQTYEYYAGCVEEITELPTDPSGGTTVSLSDDDSELISLTGGAEVSLYGVSYTSFYISSNGYLTFGASDTDYDESLAEHFSLPRVAGLYDDLDPSSGGTVSWKQLEDRVVVTYLNVPEYNESTTNTFQFELLFDGEIHINYLAVAAADGVAGLSEGEGLPDGFFETDLSGMGACGPKPPVASGDSVSTAANTPVTVMLTATDDGLPEPATLVYIITTLPTSGTLTDPQAGAIDTVPYELANGGNEVTYTPGLWFYGTDAFNFKANDGGVAPEGGDSNEAVISIDVTLPAADLIYSYPLDSDPGWSTEGQWAYGTPMGWGSHNADPDAGYTGGSVYGYNLLGDYANNIATPYYLTTTAIDCSGLISTELRFWRWLGVERAPYDNATIEVSNNGADWTTLWANPAGGSISDSAWSQIVFDISAEADGEPTVYVRWSMGSTDSGTSYPGWNIDDVEIYGIDTTPQIVGDLDGDGDVDLADLQILLSNYGQGGMGYADGDFDGDGDVDLADLQVLLANYGQQG